jgi:hypothetical protein
MITDFKSYMTSSKDLRQSHLVLTEECVERGGNSTNHRGVLAQYLDTIIPMGRVAVLAHACNNANCSNPKHLYWATDKENIVEDGTKFGTHKSPWHRQVDKYGYEEACRMNARGDKTAGGKANKGKPKTEEHKRNIAKSLTKGLTTDINDV